MRVSGDGPDVRQWPSSSAKVVCESFVPDGAPTKVAVFAVLLLFPTSAEAHRLEIPAFARKYGLSCAVCHSPAPRLTPAGEAFAANGFEFQVGEERRDTVATGDPLLRLQRSAPPMLPKGGANLNSDPIRAVAAYVHSLSNER